jgi:hypothetical protein
MLPYSIRKEHTKPVALVFLQARRHFDKSYSTIVERVVDSGINLSFIAVKGFEPVVLSN